MSERIDVRGGIKIAGASGAAVRGEVTALTRRVPAGQAVPAPAAAVAYRFGGARRSSRPMTGIRRSRTAVFARAGRALPS